MATMRIAATAVALLVMLCSMTGCGKKTWSYDFKYKTKDSVIGPVTGAEHVTVGICPFDAGILRGKELESEIANFKIDDVKLGTTIAESIAYQLRKSHFQTVIITDPQADPRLKDGSVQALVKGKISSIVFNTDNSFILTTDGVVVGDTSVNNFRAKTTVECKITSQEDSSTIWNGVAVIKASTGAALNDLLTTFVNDICTHEQFKNALRQLCAT